MSSKKRDYDKEYAEYHSKPEQIKRRSQRNKARRKAGLKVGDPREVHHVGSNRKGPLGNKTKVISKKKNRSKQPKRDGSQD